MSGEKSLSQSQPSKTAATWHLRRGEHVIGPLTTRQLRKLVEQQKLDANDFVKRSGTNRWRSATKIDGFQERKKSPDESSEVERQNEVWDEDWDVRVLWFISGGNAKRHGDGPFTFRRLEDWAKEGLLFPEDQIGKLTRREIEFGVEPEFSSAESVEGLKFCTEAEREGHELARQSKQAATETKDAINSMLAIVVVIAVPLVTGVLWSYLFGGSAIFAIIMSVVAGVAAFFAAAVASDRTGSKSESILAAGAVFLVVMFLFAGPKWGRLSDSETLAFVDNPENYKGQTLTVEVEYAGRSIRDWMEEGKLPYDLNAPFEFRAKVNGSYVHQMMYLTIPGGTSPPPLRNLETAIVTFECTEGSLGDGNLVTKIRRR